VIIAIAPHTVKQIKDLSLYNGGEVFAWGNGYLKVTVASTI